MSKSQKTMRLAAMAPHLLGDKSKGNAGQPVAGNRVGAASPIGCWELPSQLVGGVWYGPLYFTSFAAYKAAKAARARQARLDAKASVTRVDVITRPACTGGKSYGVAKRPVNRDGGEICNGVDGYCEGTANMPFLMVEAPASASEAGNNCTHITSTWGTELVLPTAKTVKVKAAPQVAIPRRVRAVAAHVKWVLAEAASAAKATAKVARKVAKMEKAKGEKVTKKAVVALKALQAVKNPRVQGAPVAMATEAELLRAWSRA